MVRLGSVGACLPQRVSVCDMTRLSDVGEDSGGGGGVQRLKVMLDRPR